MTSRIRSVSVQSRIAAALCAVILGVGLTFCGALAAQAAPRCAPDSGSNFARTTPTVAQLNKASLRCADFRGATLDHIEFEQADLEGADFRRAVVTRSDFSQATLTDADFSDATLTGTSFEQAEMGGVTLSHVHGRGADFEQVNLDGVSLTGSDLHNADLSQATLKHANLSGTDLRGASLDQADLTGANLRGADIAATDLSEATTTDAHSAGIVGLTPLDLFSAIIVLLVALLALRPRLAARRVGRAAAWVVVLVLAGLTVLEAVSSSGWQPTGDELFVLPFLTPVVFLAIFIGRVIRRPRNGWPAAVIALIALVGFYLVVTAGLAVLVDNVFGILPFTDTCSSISCGYGVARGLSGIVIGVVLIAVATIFSRVKALAKPAPDLAQWEAMQSRGGAEFATGARSTTSAFSGASTGVRPPNESHSDDRPPSQTI